MSDESRLDRLEKLAEQILEGLQTTNNNFKEIKDSLEGLQSTKDDFQQFRQELKELKNRTDSNARAIEALTNLSSEDRKERQKMNQAITRFYDSLSMMHAAQSSLWEVQADYYRRLEEVDQKQEEMAKREARMLEILDRLEQRLPPQTD
jgi:uncharacterized phage infection (PIP) family protein YhgE